MFRLCINTAPATRHRVLKAARISIHDVQAHGNAAWRPCLWHVVAPGRRESAKGSEERLQRRRRLHAGRQSEQGSGGGAGGLSMHRVHGQIRRREASADWRGVMRCCKLTSGNRRQFESELLNRASWRAVYVLVCDCYASARSCIGITWVPVPSHLRDVSVSALLVS